MRALKDKKITLYQQVLEGNHRELFKPVHEGQLWAHVRDLSSEEIYNAYSTGTNEEARFIINWRADVNANVINLSSERTSNVGGAMISTARTSGK